MYVADVASAVVAALKDDGSSMGKLYELGGPDIYTLHELVILISLSSHDLLPLARHLFVVFFELSFLLIEYKFPVSFHRLKLCTK